MPKKDYIQEASENIAGRCVGSGKLVGFDPSILIMILTTVLPSIIKLFQGGCGGQSDDEENPVEFVEKNYNERTGTYSKKLMSAVAKEAIQKAKKQKKKLSKNAALVVAFETLEEVRTQPRKVGAAVRQVA